MRRIGQDALRGLDPVQAGHGDVHNDDVRFELAGQVDRLLTLAGLADHGDSGLLFQEEA